MGKPFNQDLEQVHSTILWAAEREIGDIQSYLFNSIATPVVFVGSGGSYSACHFASMLHRDHCGMAQPMTPLLLMEYNRRLICKNKICYLSASGGNKDILNSYSALAKEPEVKLYNICMKPSNKLQKAGEEMLGDKEYKGSNYDMPTKKDGFLAVNSLVAYFVILAKVYSKNLDLKPILDSDYQQPYNTNFAIDLHNITHFTVLYGKLGEAVAYDIESKMSEAALGDVQLADYRNFGHGRHHWFDKRLAGSCILALITPEDRELAEKTLQMMPDNVPVIYINTELSGCESSIDLLIKSFYLTRDLGECRGIDPGKPGVPDYGSTLYHLNYLNCIRKPKTNCSIEDTAIARKCGVNHIWQADPTIVARYRAKLHEFVNKLTSTTFDMIAFDYDGTLSGTSTKDRFGNEVNPKMKEALEQLLKANVRVVVVTGRGNSILEALERYIDEEYRDNVLVGPYNGLYFLSMKQLRTSHVNPGRCDIVQPNDELSQMHDTLKEYVTTEISQKSHLLQIKQVADVSRLYDLCRSIMAKHRFASLNIIKSTHSIDIVYSNRCDKAKVKDLTQGNILCIGDCGAYGGNDYSMLALPYSLSVDSVSQDYDTCWNLAPADTMGVKATLHYLKSIVIKEGYFTYKPEI